MEMTLWLWAAECRAVLELAGRAPGLELELMIYFGDGRTRAVWMLSQRGRLLRWVDVGDA
jgi:hypothetical protein